TEPQTPNPKHRISSNYQARTFLSAWTCARLKRIGMSALAECWLGVGTRGDRRSLAVAVEFQAAGGLFRERWLVQGFCEFLHVLRGADGFGEAARFGISLVQQGQNHWITLVRQCSRLLVLGQGRFELAGTRQHRAKLGMRLDILRFEQDHGVKGCSSVVQAALRGEDSRQIKPGDVVGWLKLSHLLEMAFGFFELGLLGQEQSQFQLCMSEVGLEPHRLGKMTAGLVQLAKLLQSSSELVLGSGRIPESEQDGAQIVVSIGGVWIKFEGLPVMLGSVAKLALCSERIGKAEMNAGRVSGVEQAGVILGDGFLQLVLLREESGEIISGRREFRLGLNRPLKPICGTLEIAELFVAPAKVVGGQR